MTRHYDEAERELRAALLERPDDFGTLMDLGFVLIADNHAEQAIPVLEKAAVSLIAAQALWEFSPGPMPMPDGAPMRCA